MEYSSQKLCLSSILLITITVTMMRSGCISSVDILCIVLTNKYKTCSSSYTAVKADTVRTVRRLNVWNNFYDKVAPMSRLLRSIYRIEMFQLLRVESFHDFPSALH